jgi:hypothetical protein
MEEVIIPLPERVQPTHQARGLLISNSVLMLRERGLFDRYIEHVPSPKRDEVIGTTPGSWVPIEVAETHYRACNELGLSESEQFDLGHAAGLRIRSVVLASVAKVARAMGMEAWSAFKQYPRMWSRSYLGGGVGVTRIGHKDARIDVVGFTLAYIPYVRNGFRGTNQAGFELFSKDVQMRELSSSDDALAIRVTWT